MTFDGKDVRSSGLVGSRRVVSMRLIVSGAAAALVTLCIIGVGAVSEKNTRELLASEVEARLLLEASNLAHLSSDALLDDFPELTLNPVVSEIQEKRPDLAVVTVLDHRGAIKGHADVRMYGMSLALLDSLTPVETSLELDAGEVFLGNDRLLVGLELPMFRCSAITSSSWATRKLAIKPFAAAA